VNATIKKWATRRGALATIGAAAALSVVAAACGSSPASGPTGATSGPTGATSAPTATSAPASSGHGAALVKMVTNAKLGDILTNSEGFTLYHYTLDKPGKIACTGQCATIWPPLLLPAGARTPTGASGVSGLGTVTRPGGKKQVTWDGEPLYTFSGDSSAGQANGQGYGNDWFVLKAGSSTTTAAPTTTTVAPTTSTSSGGNGY
jgi:predicted lipoprotein with Yx(FWY)xxD motif